MKMFIDISNGNINIDGEILHKRYTFEDFKKSSLFSEQKPEQYIQLGRHFVGDRYFFLSIMFRNDALKCISLSLDDDRCKGWEDEPKLKIIHDEYLISEGISPDNNYDWGKIESVFDERGGFSSIIISYR